MARVYIHEFVDVVGTKRSLYQQHMTANWVPEAGPLRRQRCFGVFSLVGSTGRWPQVVNIWEYDNWGDLAHNFSVELSGPGHRDPMLEKWWAEAAAFRTGGVDRILVGHEGNPGIEELESNGGTDAVAYIHEIITTPPGGASEVCAIVNRVAVSDHAEYGFRLVGIWRTAMRANDEVILLWSIPDWDSWASFESDLDSENRGVMNHRRSLSGKVVSRERVLLVDAEFSPLRTGRQPQESDRRPLE